MQQDAPLRWDRTMQQRLARGEAAALGELYDRFASLVHGLARRVLVDEHAADAVTREVFAHVWEHPEAYDPRQGPLRSWLAGLAHRLAVQRLRAAGAAALARDGAGSEEDLEQRIDTSLSRALPLVRSQLAANAAAREPALAAG